MPAQRAHLVDDVVCVERCDSYGAATERARQLLLGGKTALVSIYDRDPRRDQAARPVQRAWGSARRLARARLRRPVFQGTDVMRLLGLHARSGGGEGMAATMTTSAIGTHLGQRPGPLLGSTALAGDDCFAALVVVLGASLVSVAALRWRRPTRLSLLVALVSAVACCLASVLPRAVGADTAQPIRASLLILALGVTAVACVRPGAWRRLAVCLHVAGGFAVAVLSVDLVGSHLDARGRPRYVVPSDQEERAELRPTWHTPVTGVYRNPHAELPRLAVRRWRRSCSAGSVPMTEQDGSGFHLAYAWGWCPPGSIVAKKRWVNVIGVDQVGRSWVEEMSATIDRRTGATANPTIWWLASATADEYATMTRPRLIVDEPRRRVLVVTEIGTAYGVSDWDPSVHCWAFV